MASLILGAAGAALGSEIFINDGAEVIGLINSTVTLVKTMIAESRDPTPQEWNALHAKIAALSPNAPSPFPQYATQ